MKNPMTSSGSEPVFLRSFVVDIARVIPVGHLLELSYKTGITLFLRARGRRRELMLGTTAWKAIRVFCAPTL
jgi:hypothetical protein